MLKDWVHNVLDECRMLILGGQVLISFASESVIEPGFRELSLAGRAACVAGMICLVMAIGLLMWPAAHHRIATGGQDTPGLLQVGRNALGAGLVPFGLGLALSLYVVGERTQSPMLGAAIGAGSLLTEFVAWYLVPILARRRSAHREHPMKETTGTPLDERIRQVLTEARMVLPGAQALLGVGAVSTLMDRYKELAPALKAVHATGLCFIALAVVLLMMPAAYHRIAEDSRDTEHFHAVASRLLLMAMAALAPGLAAAVWLVVEIASGQRAAGVGAGVVTLLAFYGLWFVAPMIARFRPRRSSRPSRGELAR